MDNPKRIIPKHRVFTIEEHKEIGIFFKKLRLDLMEKVKPYNKTEYRRSTEKKCLELIEKLRDKLDDLCSLDLRDNFSSQIYFGKIEK